MKFLPAEAVLNFLVRWRIPLFFLWTVAVFIGAAQYMISSASNLTLFAGVEVLPENTWSSFFNGLRFVVSNGFFLSVVYIHVVILKGMVVSEAAEDRESNA